MRGLVAGKCRNNGNFILLLFFGSVGAKLTPMVSLTVFSSDVCWCFVWFLRINGLMQVSGCVGVEVFLSGGNILFGCWENLWNKKYFYYAQYKLG